MEYNHDFTYVDEPVPHYERVHHIMKAHPEVKKLIGKSPVTAVWIAVCVSIQFVLAYLLRDQSWWLIVAVSWFIGAFPAHALYIIYHEACHNLIFKKATNNIYAGIVANLSSVIPTYVAFKTYHLRHHSHMGVPGKDADLPDAWEAKLIDNYFIGKALWLLFFAVFQAIRTARYEEKIRIDRWLILNYIVMFSADVAIVYFIGWKALVYLGLSFWFCVGLHPLGARWIQEHYLVLDPKQETFSYYGPLSLITLNVGYHNEHHDIPAIPWNNLPKLKKIAPEFYDNLKYHTSYSKLLLQFLFSQEIGLFSRIVRKERIEPPSKIRRSQVMSEASITE